MCSSIKLLLSQALQVARGKPDPHILKRERRPNNNKALALRFPFYFDYNRFRNAIDNEPDSHYSQVEPQITTS